MKEYSEFVFDYKNDIISSADIKIKQMEDSLDEIHIQKKILYC